MKLAAIDIGSNAIRFQVVNVLTYQNEITFKKIEYVRFPLRLGKDVFAEGTITPPNQERFVKLMQAFQLLLELYEVDDYLAYATSAMREAENGAALVAQVREATGLEIEIIDGEKEAEFINRAVTVMIDELPYLHIDVGGGSTELTYWLHRERQASRSFPIGSVRRLGKKDAPEVWDEMKAWVKQEVGHLHGRLRAVGTGGNINKIFELAKKKAGKPMSRDKVKEVRQYLAGMPLEERIHHLRLNPDRADVIVPASDIYITVMEFAQAKSILVPDMGLKDGMLRYLYERNVPGA